MAADDVPRRSLADDPDFRASLADLDRGLSDEDPRAESTTGESPSGSRERHECRDPAGQQRCPSCDGGTKSGTANRARFKRPAVSAGVSNRLVVASAASATKSPPALDGSVPPTRQVSCTTARSCATYATARTRGFT